MFTEEKEDDDDKEEDTKAAVERSKVLRNIINSLQGLGWFLF